MQEKKRKFRLFDSQREGKGVTPEDTISESNLKRFFRIWRDNFFSRLFTINLMVIIANIPLIFALMAFFGVGKAEYFIPTSDLFPILHGVGTVSGEVSPSALALIGVAGMQKSAYAATAWTYIFYGIGAISFATWGCVSCGMTYLLRNITMGRPVFLWSDFIDAIRTNWKQALPFGVFDLAILLLLPANIYSMLRSESNYLTSLFFWASIVLFLVYFIMRWYIYLQMVSFRLKTWKIIKNSLRFVLIGIKRNLLALLGIAILVALTFLFLFAFNGVLIVLALAIPLMMLFSNGGFMATYAAWEPIDRIMVIHEEEESEEYPDESDIPDEEEY